MNQWEVNSTKLAECHAMPTVLDSHNTACSGQQQARGEARSSALWMCRRSEALSHLYHRSGAFIIDFETLLNSLSCSALSLPLSFELKALHFFPLKAQRSQLPGVVWLCFQVKTLRENISLSGKDEGPVLPHALRKGNLTRQKNNDPGTAPQSRFDNQETV